MSKVACTGVDRRGSISFKADVPAAPGLLYWLVLKEFRNWVKIYVKCIVIKDFFLSHKSDFVTRFLFYIR